MDEETIKRQKALGVDIDEVLHNHNAVAVTISADGMVGMHIPGSMMDRGYETVLAETLKIILEQQRQLKAH